MKKKEALKSRQKAREDENTFTISSDRWSFNY